MGGRRIFAHSNRENFEGGPLPDLPLENATGQSQRPAIRR